MSNYQNDYLKNWVFRANEDIAVIENLYKSDPELFASPICYHSQQSVEKFLKAYLVYCNIDFPKTHDLDYLLQECKKVNNEFFNIELGSLSDFGVSIRYPDDFYLPDMAEVNFYRDISLQVKKIVEELISL